MVITVIKRMFQLIIFFVVFLFAVNAHSTLVLITKVIDGDTIIMDVEGISMKARLAYVDAPELDQEIWGITAKTFLTKLLNIYPEEMNLPFLGEAQAIQVGIGAYNRPLILLFSEGICLNLALVELGLAETYFDSKTPAQWRKIFTFAENRAKEKKTGIWGDENYISPKEWRQSKKK